MEDERDIDSATQQLDKDNATQEPSDDAITAQEPSDDAITTIQLKDTMTGADWESYGITNLEPFRTIVQHRRQYKDNSDDEDRFEWELDDVKTLETEIIARFRKMIGKKATIVFVPAGWLVMQLEKEVIADITPLKNPFPLVKQMTPPAMYALARVYDPKDRNKIFDYIRRRVLPFVGPEDNRRLFINPEKWSYISEELKENAAEVVKNGLGLSKFVQFDGSWFYIWLLHRARKNISKERREEILDMANELERENME